MQRRRGIFRNPFGCAIAIGAIALAIVPCILGALLRDPKMYLVAALVVFVGSILATESFLTESSRGGSNGEGQRGQ